MDWSSAVIGGVVTLAATMLVARIKTRSDERRSGKELAILLGEYVQNWKGQFIREEGRESVAHEQMSQWDAARIVGPMSVARIKELAPDLPSDTLKAVLGFQERARAYDDEMRILYEVREEDMDMDAPAILARFILDADAVLQIARKRVGLSSPLEDPDTGIEHIRNWLPERLQLIAKRDARRSEMDSLVDMNPPGPGQGFRTEPG